MVEALNCAGKSLQLNRARVMGVLNVTPDSFSDGGFFMAKENALQQAQNMVDEGADIVDVGGESTRPGAASVSVQEELDRVIPVIESIRNRIPVIISIDTSKPEVMREAVSAGASMINDVYALRLEGALQAAADLAVPVCLMHMQGEPRTMQTQPHYINVVNEIKDFLKQRRDACLQAGVKRDNILLDPGFGFGKSVQHNLTIVKNLNSFTDLGIPLLVGFSRKSTIGAILDKPASERLMGSISLVSLARWLGAAIFRVHDVKATVEALKVCDAVIKAES